MSLRETKIVNVKPKVQKKGTFTSLHNDIKVYNIHIVNTNKIDKHPHRYHLDFNADGKYFKESPAGLYGYDKVEELYKLGLTRQLVQADLDEYLNIK